MGLGTGSKKWFNYTTDFGVTRPILRDENNGEGKLSWDENNPCLEDFANNSENAGNPILGDRPIQCRYIECYCSTDVKSVRKFTIGTLAKFVAVYAAEGPKITLNTGSDADSATEWIPYRFVAEKSRMVATPVDSGKDDGDAT